MIHHTIVIYTTRCTQKLECDAQFASLDPWRPSDHCHLWQNFVHAREKWLLSPIFCILSGAVPAISAISGYRTIDILVTLW